jgi:predicted ATPase
MIENPEAHLHPRGQVAMGRLMALAASIGVQILVETHSDHVLNGIRLAVKAGEIPPDDVKLHFFRRDRETKATVIETPPVARDGRLGFWPEDFFDQWEKSLDELLDD